MFFAKKTRFFACTVWIIASIFYAYQYILRVMPNIMIGNIMTTLGMNEAVFGQFSGIYYIGYSLMHMPLGFLLDRFGPKKIMTAAIGLTIVGLMPLIFTHSIPLAIIGRLCTGIGSSAAILGVFTIIRLSFQEKHFSRMLSFSVMIGLTGAIYGGAPVSYMQASYGPSAVMWLLTIFGAFLAILTYWIVPDVHSEAKTGIWKQAKAVYTNKSFIFTCIFAGLLVGPLEGFADVWGAKFLERTFGFEQTDAASITSLTFVGMCFGAPILSTISEKFSSPLVTIVGAGAIMAAAFSIILVLSPSVETLSGIFLVIGVCSAYQILAIYKASTFVPNETRGFATACANMIIMLFGYLFHVAIGAIISSCGGIQSKEALVLGVSIIPCALWIGTVGFCTLIIKEKFSKKTA